MRAASYPVTKRRSSGQVVTSRKPPKAHAQNRRPTNAGQQHHTSCEQHKTHKRATNGNPPIRALRMYQTRTPRTQHPTAHATKVAPTDKESTAPTQESTRESRRRGNTPAPASAPRHRSAGAQRYKEGLRPPWGERWEKAHTLQMSLGFCFISFQGVSPLPVMKEKRVHSSAGFLRYRESW